MNWYKKAEIDIINAYENFSNVLREQSPQYGLLSGNGDVSSVKSNKIRLFVSDPENQFRYVINLRIEDDGTDMIVFSLNSQGNLFTKNYDNHDVYSIINDALSLITENINSVRGSN